MSSNQDNSTREKRERLEESRQPPERTPPQMDLAGAGKPPKRTLPLPDHPTAVWSGLGMQGAQLTPEQATSEPDGKKSRTPPDRTPPKEEPKPAPPKEKPKPAPKKQQGD
jgi:hypothetical protein